MREKGKIAVVILLIVIIIAFFLSIYFTVDEEIPGDRKSECGGAMKPFKTEVKRDGYVLWHKCMICGKVAKNRSSKEDEFEEIVKLVAGRR
jgi:hypothetical protein